MRLKNGIDAQLYTIHSFGHFHYTVMKLLNI